MPSSWRENVNPHRFFAGRFRTQKPSTQIGLCRISRSSITKSAFSSNVSWRFCLNRAPPCLSPADSFPNPKRCLCWCLQDRYPTGRLYSAARKPIQSGRRWRSLQSRAVSSFFCPYQHKTTSTATTTLEAVCFTPRTSSPSSSLQKG
jgi:hypothetical protein